MTMMRTRRPASACSCHVLGLRTTFLALFAAIFACTSRAVNLKETNKSPDVDINIIDLDGDASNMHPSLNSLKNEVKHTLGKGKGFIKSAPSKAPAAPTTAATATTAMTVDVTFDDDDLQDAGSGSGSGSGSGAITEEERLRAKGERLTPTESSSMVNASSTTPTMNASTHGIISQEDPAEVFINLTGQDKPRAAEKHQHSHPETLNNVVVDHMFIDTDIEDGDLDMRDAQTEEEDSMYDLPPATQVTSNQISSPASWNMWSEWFVAVDLLKVRIRSCQAEGGQEVSELACSGARAQIKSCDNGLGDSCGKVQNLVAAPDGSCEQKSKLSSTSSPSQVPQVPPTAKPDPDACRYSLYDVYRQKYALTRWNLTELITKSKVRRWCDRQAGKYLVMMSPEDHCRRYYNDLCKVSEKCHANKPTKERDDFAEGCWRNLVYDEMLPVGLASKETAVYLICQRFATQSKMGKHFGFQESHFATLYDTGMRSPVVAMNVITRLGDETWPVTDYFIEHGLVENESNMLFLLKKPGKGMLTLRDLDRCQDDQGCDVGLRQILPHEYLDSSESVYSPTHLMWPELMSIEPASRVATFTLTNMAPLLTDLLDEWRRAVKKIRRFAIEQCGVPVVLDHSLKHVGEFSSHRSNQSALYIMSGVLPSSDPIVTTGQRIRVPFMFWMAGCCIQQQQSSSKDGVTATLDHVTDHVTNDTTNRVNGTTGEVHKVRISGFSVYIRNAPDNHVISAPILQLEMLLQDSIKGGSSEGDVVLFPGNGGACSDLGHDVSRWFQ